MRTAIRTFSLFGGILAIVLLMVAAFRHPELTTTMVYQNYWHFFVIVLVCTVLYGLAQPKRKQ